MLSDSLTMVSMVDFKLVGNHCLAGAACSPSEVERRKQRIWERAAQATREAALNQQSVRGSIGVFQDFQ
jgi:hypothetical protein